MPLRTAAIILTFLSVYTADLFTKIIVRDRMPVGMEIKILPFFSLTHVKNTGIAFGLFQHMNHVFAGIGLVVTVLICYFAYRTYFQDRFTSLVLAAVLGGALGNLTDRLYYGRVTDFLDFYIGRYHWPVFNIADSTICVGAALLIWHNLQWRFKRR